jgi:hypothetical protein
MTTNNRKLIALILGLLILLGGASTVLSQTNEYISADNDPDLFAQRVEKKLSNIKAVVNLYPVGDESYDVLVSWHVSPMVIRELLNGDEKTKNEALGIIVGMMMYSAAVVGEEAPTTSFRSRHIVFKFNSEKVAYIPVAKCHRLMKQIKHDLTVEALEEFIRNLVMYN